MNIQHLALDDTVLYVILHQIEKIFCKYFYVTIYRIDIYQFQSYKIDNEKYSEIRYRCKWSTSIA